MELLSQTLGLSLDDISVIPKTAFIFNENCLEEYSKIFITSERMIAACINKVGKKNYIWYDENSEQLLENAILKCKVPPMFYIFYEPIIATKEEVYKPLEKLSKDHPEFIVRYIEYAESSLSDDFNVSSEVYQKNLLNTLNGYEEEKVESGLNANRLDNPSVRQEFENYINSDIKPVKTGFDKLDRRLGGGLPNGICIIGGNPGTGKTSLALNIASNISKSGIDVLFFSVELPRLNLTARLLSRQTFIDTDYDETESVSETNILAKQKENLLEKYAKSCQEVFSNHHLMLYFGRLSGEDIKRLVGEYVGQTTQKQFVIIIDYLQKLKNPNERNYSASQKVIIDNNLNELLDIKQNYQVPIVVLSSLNRDSYQDTEITIESFKESGNIEYDADLLIGLEYDITAEEVNAIKNNSKNADTGATLDRSAAVKIQLERMSKDKQRRVRLRLLKNRLGFPNEIVSMKYTSSRTFFSEDEITIKHPKSL